MTLVFVILEIFIGGNKWVYIKNVIIGHDIHSVGNGDETTTDMQHQDVQGVNMSKTVAEDASSKGSPRACSASWTSYLLSQDSVQGLAIKPSKNGWADRENYQWCSHRIAEDILILVMGSKVATLLHLWLALLLVPKGAK